MCDHVAEAAIPAARFKGGGWGGAPGAHARSDAAPPAGLQRPSRGSASLGKLWTSGGHGAVSPRVPEAEQEAPGDCHFAARHPVLTRGLIGSVAVRS